MKRFFKTIAAPAIVLFAVFVLGLSMTRCTSVDDTLGQNFIPEHQNLMLHIATLDSVKTFIARNDSIPSNFTGVIYLGMMEDAVFGATAGSAMTDFSPQSTYFNNKNFFGYRPVADSVFLQLYITNVHGNPQNAQTFNVYELRDSLKRDSIYYFNVPLQNVVDMTKPLFSFTLDVKEKTDFLMVGPLDMTAEGNAFLQRIVTTDSTIFANPDPAFHQRFYGLYIAPAPGSPYDAALYEINLRKHPELEFSSSMTIWAHNFDRENPANIKDTLAVGFPFSDESYDNMQVSRVIHNYPSPIANNISDPAHPETMTELSTVYIQSLGGVSTYLDFTALVDQLKALKPEGRDILIHQARLYFPIDDPTIANLNIAPVRLGMYYTYGQRLLVPNSVYGPIPTPDYDYEAENNSYNPVTIPYNGFIYRSINPVLGSAYYEMVITHYITRLVQDPENTPKQVWLGNEIGNSKKKRANGRNAVYSQVALRGSARAQNPVKLVVSYTLVR